MASVGSILGGAFGLLVRRPVAVVIWAVTYGIGTVLISLASNLVMFGKLVPTQEDALAQTWTLGTFGLALLLNLLLLLLAVVLMNAVFRAMLRPEEGGFAFMRLGMDEWRMFGLVILFNIACFVAFLVGWLMLFLVMMVLGFVLGKGVVVSLMALLLFLAFFCAVIWVAVRVSLIFPLTFDRRRISVDAAWELTRGRFWLLFACYFLVALLFTIIAGAFFWHVVGDYILAVMRAGDNPEQVEALRLAFNAQQLALPVTTKILYVAIGAILFAAALALGPGLSASATRELLGDGEEAAVFAAESDGSIMD